MKKALITGITGQDGSYLADFLLAEGYEVHGIVRRTSNLKNRARLDHIVKEGSYTSDVPKCFYLHYGDLTDSSSIEKILQKVKPDEIYNLGAQSHVGVSFDVPENTVNVVALGTLRMLEAIRKICPNTKFYQASSSEMFGKVEESPQTEETRLHPRSPYGCAKVFAYNITINYREAYGLHASNGILFNHEGERRGESFVTRKITRSLARIKMGLQEKMSVGNLNAKRDWGHAKDFVEAMWLILQQDEPDDYVIGTGEHHSVREFLEQAAKSLGLNIKSNGEEGINEKYLDQNGNIIIDIDPQYFRPSEVETLCANSEKAKIKLGWEPKTKFEELVKIMADHDLRLAQDEKYLQEKNNPIPISEKIKEITTCRICGNSNLVPIVDLGLQPLSGRFPAQQEPNPLKSPLQLVKCDDSQNNNACGLLQLKHNVEPNEMYGETYGYRSGLNKTMTNHLSEVANIAENLVELNSTDVVLDIGSSDGVLLKAYKKQGIERIGIDPAAEKFLKYYPEDIKLITDFFSAEKFKLIYPYKKPKIITSIAMFYDLEQPMNFVRDIKQILHKDGIWICEQSYMPQMLKINAFDTICQEHLEYYSLKQIEWMLEKCGLKVFDIEFNETNGASFRVYICHNENPRKINTEKLNEVRNNEIKLKLNVNEPYREFNQRIEKIKQQIFNFLKSEKAKDKKIHIYGASTKGNVLLHYFNIGKEIVDFAADRNPDKWGKRTPGTNIPIISEQESRSKNPDYYLVLPWHFRKEFIEREQEFLKKGGKLVFPLPEPEVVGIDNSTGLFEYSHLE